MRTGAINLVTADRAIGLRRMRRHDDTPMHHHDNVELAIVLDGSAEHLTASGSWTIQRGDVIAVPVGVDHGYARCSDMHLVNVGWTPERAGLPEARLARLPGYHALTHLEPALRARHEVASHLRLDDTQLAAVAADLERLERELASATPGHELACAALLTQILVTCARCYAAAETPTTRALVRLAELLAWLDERYAKPMRIEQLAARARVSKSTLTRLFRRCLGRAPLDYVIDLRLRHACDRLRAGATVADAARAVGFDDANYFARRFRRTYGCSPRAWRARGAA